MFLTIDYTGPASGTHYGFRGDRVEVIPFEGFNTLVLVENKGQRFWISKDDLSETPIYESQTDRREPKPDRKAVKAVAGGKRKNYKYGR